MASAYATLANGGKHVEPTIILRVKDATGKVIWEAEPKRDAGHLGRRGLRGSRILADNMQSGTGTKADIERPLRGQDRHRPGLVRRLVLRLHPSSVHGGLDGPPRGQIAMDDVHGIKVTGGSFPAEMWAQVHVHDADRG